MTNLVTSILEQQFAKNMWQCKWILLQGTEWKPGKRQKRGQKRTTGILKSKQSLQHMLCHNSTFYHVKMAKFLDAGYHTRSSIVSQSMHLMLHVLLQWDWKSCHVPSPCLWAWISGSSQPPSIEVWWYYVISRARLGKEGMRYLLGVIMIPDDGDENKKVDVFYCIVVHILE